MKDIAESTESTAEAIQKQAIMCSDIQEHTDAAENDIHEMIEASQRTDATVRVFRCIGTGENGKGRKSPV